MIGVKKRPAFEIKNFQKFSRKENKWAVKEV
jgi:hypothetical protein